MRTENLKGWRQESKREKDPEGIRRELVVRLFKVMFSDGSVLEDIYWETMVLLPKGKGEYRGIRIVEALWKEC